MTPIKTIVATAVVAVGGTAAAFIGLHAGQSPATAATAQHLARPAHAGEASVTMTMDDLETLARLLGGRQARERDHAEARADARADARAKARAEARKAARHERRTHEKREARHRHETRHDTTSPTGGSASPARATSHAGDGHAAGSGASHDGGGSHHGSSGGHD